MKYGKYQQFRHNPPKLNVKENARELIITTVSCMCDNIHYLTLKKNSDGDFKLDTIRFALSNWQMNYPKHKIEWAADEGRWSDVFEMINSGTEVISEVESR
jgi:hypothetical protein